MPAAAIHSTRLVREYRQSILAPPERVFPLLCPVREKEWLRGWDCRMIYSRSGYAEPGCVFATVHHGTAEAVWMVIDHAVPRHVRFVRVTPGETAVEIDIRLAPAGADGSSVEVRYTYTALGPAGEQAIAAMTEESWLGMMDYWEQSMNHFLLTGQRLNH